MSLTDTERAFLTMIAGKPQGRVSYALVRRDGAMSFAGSLLARGFIRERRLGYDEGFQISPSGKAYLAGEQL